MDGTAVIPVPIREQSARSRRPAARRSSLHPSPDFSERDCGRLAIVVTEAATNILRHGGGGEIILDARSYDHSGEVNILALDGGPGMANVQDCLRDGVSTADSAGTGLGAIQRQSDHFDIYSAGLGTAIVCGVRTTGYQQRPRYPGLEVGVVCLPRIGEAVSGDGWAARVTERGATLLLMCDGLGHGLGAAEAANAARIASCARKNGCPNRCWRICTVRCTARGAPSSAWSVSKAHDRRIRFAGSATSPASSGGGPANPNGIAKRCRRA